MLTYCVLPHKRRKKNEKKRKRERTEFVAFEENKNPAAAAQFFLFSFFSLSLCVQFTFDFGEAKRWKWWIRKKDWTHEQQQPTKHEIKTTNLFGFFSLSVALFVIRFVAIRWVANSYDLNAKTGSFDTHVIQNTNSHYVARALAERWTRIASRLRARPRVHNFEINHTHAGSFAHASLNRIRK